MIFVVTAALLVVTAWLSYRYSAYVSQKSTAILLAGLWQRGYLKEEAFHTSHAEASAIFEAGWVYLEKNGGEMPYDRNHI